MAANIPAITQGILNSINQQVPAFLTQFRNFINQLLATAAGNANVNLTAVNAALDAQHAVNPALLDSASFTALASLAITTYNTASPSTAIVQTVVPLGTYTPPS